GLPIDKDAVTEVDWIIRFVGEIRTARAELNVPPGAELDIVVEHAGESTRRRIAYYQPLIATNARLKKIEVAGDRLPVIPKGAIQLVVDEATIVVPLSEVIDIAAERRRLGREIEKVRSEIDKIDRKLANPDFLAKAPPEVVADQRERRVEAE